MMASFKRVSEITAGDMIVGESGGISSVLDIRPSSILTDRWIITTEHGTMNLRSDIKVIIKAV